MNEKAKQVFNSVDIAGVSYVPLCVSTQVVNGTNYRYLCEATVVYPNAVPYNVLFTIYESSKGETTITEIGKVDINK